MENVNSFEENNFVDRQMLTYFENAKKVLAEFHFDTDMQQRFENELQPRIIRGDSETGSEVPNVTFESYDKLWLDIEPEPILVKAEEIARKIDDAEVADITKLFVTVGVAKAVLWYKLMIDDGGNQKAKVGIYSKEKLLDAVDFDYAIGGNMRKPLISDLDDDEIDIINALRFGFGISMNAVFESEDHIDSLKHIFKSALERDEQIRKEELRTALSLLTIESAFKFYRSNVDFILLAASFPKDYGEIMDLFNKD